MRFSETVVRKTPEMLAFDAERHIAEFSELVGRLWDDLRCYRFDLGISLDQIRGVRDAFQQVSQAFFQCDAGRLPKAYDGFEKAVKGLMSSDRPPLPADLEGQRSRWASEMRTAFATLSELERSRQVKSLSKEVEQLIEEADRVFWFRNEPMAPEAFGDRIATLWRSVFRAIIHKWGVRT